MKSIGKCSISTLKRAVVIELLAITILVVSLIKGKVKEIPEVTGIFNENENSIYENALINTYLADLQQASDEYYKDYFTNSPTIAYYYVELIELRSDNKNNPSIYITFLTMPFIGPHDIIGEDEITFLASYTGEVKLVGFKHLKSYELPENLKGLEK